MASNGSASFVAAPGVTLGQYVLVRELGAGGMGRVFEAKHVQLGKRVAIKLLHKTLSASPRALRRFLREGRACSRIIHPHVVEVLDAGVQNGQPYLVMELVEGVDLGTWLRQKQKLDLSELADIFLPLCSALWAVHQGGIVHRDLKPSNVILTRSRPHVVHPMLVDFGVAKLSFTETTDDLTKTDSTVGTVAYMAPEQTRDAQAAQPATDQYALGVMLYECATGRRPFQGESQYDLMHAILHAEVAPPSEHRSDLGPEFDALVLRALRRAPAERFPTIHALGAALLALASPRAWAAWGPEFCATDAAVGGTQADAPRGPRRATASEPALAVSKRAARNTAVNRRAEVATVEGFRQSTGTDGRWSRDQRSLADAGGRRRGRARQRTGAIRAALAGSRRRQAHRTARLRRAQDPDDGRG